MKSRCDPLPSATNRYLCEPFHWGPALGLTLFVKQSGKGTEDVSSPVNQPAVLIRTFGWDFKPRTFSPSHTNTIGSNPIINVGSLLLNPSHPPAPSIRPKRYVAPLRHPPALG